MSEEDNGKPGVRTEKVLTVGMKRRSVLRVLKSVQQDAQREVGRDRVTGIFGIVTREDGTVSIVSAVTAVEMKLVMRAIPEALQAIALAFEKKGPRKVGE